MTAHDGLLNAIIIVLAINFLMFVSGWAVNDLGGVNPFNPEDNILNQYNTGANGSYDVPADPGGIIPGTAGSGIDPDTQTPITDIFTSIKSWFTDTLGLGVVANIVGAPKVLLSAIGMPEALAWAITALWYGITIFLIVGYIWGR